MVGIPVKLRLQEIVDLLDKQFKDQFNFINCPPNDENFGENLGYFVINFKNTEKIYRFTKDFLDKKLLSCEDTDDDCRAWRTVQFCRVQRVACDARINDSTCVWKQNKMPTATTNDYRVVSQVLNTIMMNSEVQGRKEKYKEIALVDESTEEVAEKGKEKEKEKRQRKGSGIVLEIEKAKAKGKEEEKEGVNEEGIENEVSRKRKSGTRFEKGKSVNLDEGFMISKDKNRNKNMKENECRSTKKCKNKKVNNEMDEKKYEDDQSEIPALTDGVARKKMKKNMSSHNVNIPIIPTTAFLTTLPLPLPLPLLPFLLTSDIRSSNILDSTTREKNSSRSNTSTIKNFNVKKNNNSEIKSEAKFSVKSTE